MTSGVFDISMAIDKGIPVYEGEMPPKHTFTSYMAKGDAANVSRIDLGAHTGTHVDAPFHFLPDRETVDELSVDYFSGRVFVLDCGNSAVISHDTLNNKSEIREHTGILFKTTNSRHHRESFIKSFVALDVSGALDLVARGIRLVGIDYLSIEGFGSGEFPVHKILLGHNVAVIEGLDLSSVEEGSYQLYCLPLKIVGADGAPARAMLVREG